MFAHSTASMGVGYASEHDQTVKVEPPTPRELERYLTAAIAADGHDAE